MFANKSVSPGKNKELNNVDIFAKKGKIRKGPAFKAVVQTIVAQNRRKSSSDEQHWKLLSNTINDELKDKIIEKMA